MNNSTQGKSGSIFENNNNAPAAPAAPAAAAAAAVPVNNGLGAGPPPRRRTSRKELRKQLGGMLFNATNKTTSACAKNSCIGPTCSTTAQPRNSNTRKRHRSNRSRKLRR